MIYIVRHGQTETNRKRQLQGRSDRPLNDSGIAEARAAATRLAGVRFARVFSSPLTRAVQTARILAPGSEIELDDRLIEMAYGPYEGMSLDALAPEALAFFRDFVHVPAPPGMEPLGAVVERAGSFLEECCRTEEDVLVSTHAIAMKGILEYLTPESRGSYWSHFIGTCAIYVTDYEEEGFSVPFELMDGHA